MYVHSPSSLLLLTLLHVLEGGVDVRSFELLQLVQPTQPVGHPSVDEHGAHQNGHQQEEEGAEADHVIDKLTGAGRWDG
jgi:hypothetical protein